MITPQAAALSAADKAIAAKIAASTAELNGRGFSEPRETIQALDVPLAPPPDPSYPANDVIAEATRPRRQPRGVEARVLQRGHKEGLGGDKIYWKHGLINSSVFKDLISHTRPIDNQGGSLVYEVPINKAHCTSGFLGFQLHRHR